MGKKIVKEKVEFEKIDKITRIITMVSCVVLGSIFIGACVYMLNKISNPPSSEQSNSLYVKTDFSVLFFKYQ